jgi:hypothetical protein
VKTKPVQDLRRLLTAIHRNDPLGKEL